MKATHYIFLSILVLLTLSTSTSCRKKQDTIAIVRVLNESNESVQGAQVVLYGSGTEGEVDLYDTVYSNNTGEAIFNFNDRFQLGQAGFAILDISVEHNGEVANGVMKVESETVTTKTIFLGV
jgi:hypothetical protein